MKYQLVYPYRRYPDNKVHEANMESTWVLSVPDGPHVGLRNLAIWEVSTLWIRHLHFLDILFSVQSRVVSIGRLWLLYDE